MLGWLKIGLNNIIFILIIIVAMLKLWRLPLNSLLNSRSEGLGNSWLVFCHRIPWLERFRAWSCYRFDDWLLLLLR